MRSVEAKSQTVVMPHCVDQPAARKALSSVACTGFSTYSFGLRRNTRGMCASRGDRLSWSSAAAKFSCASRHAIGVRSTNLRDP